MEQLLQEARTLECGTYRTQQTNKVYQESQNDINTLKNNGTHSLTQTNNEAAKQELEEQVKRLRQRHIFIAFDFTLLENECTDLRAQSRAAR